MPTEKEDGCTQGRMSNDEDATIITPINIPSGGLLSAEGVRQIDQNNSSSSNNFTFGTSTTDVRALHAPIVDVQDLNALSAHTANVQKKKEGGDMVTADAEKYSSSIEQGVKAHTSPDDMLDAAEEKTFSEEMNAAIEKGMNPQPNLSLINATIAQLEEDENRIDTNREVPTENITDSIFDLEDSPPAQRITSPSFGPCLPTPSVETRQHSFSRVARSRVYDASDSVQVIPLPNATPLEIELVDNNNIPPDDDNVVQAQIEEMVIKIDRKKTIQAVIIAIGATVLIVGLTVWFLFSTTQPTPVLSTQSQKLQRQAMLKLYERTGGSNWSENANWLGKVHECTWFGVSCNDQMAVTKIELVLNNLKGTIGDDLLGSLSFLEVLNLSKNKLTGTLPEMLGSLTSLGILDLRHNELTGTLPDSLVSLTSLRELNLRKNKLTGMLPENMEYLSKLVNLHLGQNKFTGTLPDTLGSLTSLRELNMLENSLSGTLPDSLGSLFNLEEFNFGKNKLTGTVPDTLGSLTSLKEWWLHKNILTGMLPDSLESLSNLEIMYFEDNKLTGTLPGTLGSLTSLKMLNLSKNKLAGTVSDTLVTLISLGEMNIFDNSLTGILPDSLGSLSNLEILNFGNNKLTGSLPDTLGSLTRLKKLGVDQNKLSGTVPDTLGSLTSLKMLSLYENKLNGTVPDTLGSLSSLEILDLSSNTLNGTVPEALGSLTNLVEMHLSTNYLTGTIPDMLKYLTSLTSLTLFGNNFVGNCSTSLCDLNLNDFQLDCTIECECYNECI